MLTSEERTSLRRAGTLRRFADGSHLFTEGEPSRGLFVIEEGRIRVWITGRDGTEVLLAILGAGDLTGELSALDGYARSATAAALGPAKALVVPADRFQTFLIEEPRVAIVLLQMVTARLRGSDARHLEVVSHDVEGRLARRLLELAVQRGDRHTVTGITHEELATWVGASREAISRAMSKMRQAGWVETGRGKVEIQDPDALKRRASLGG